MNWRQLLEGNKQKRGRVTKKRCNTKLQKKGKISFIKINFLGKLNFLEKYCHANF